MNPPIPEPMAPPRILERGPRPEALKYLLLLEIWFWIAGEFIRPPYESFTESLVFGTISIASIFIYWSLWQGKNWARITVLTLSLIFLFVTIALETIPFTLGLLEGLADEALITELPPESTPLQRTFDIIYSFFGLVWFFWLQSPAMKAFCAKEPQQTQIVSA